MDGLRSAKDPMDYVRDLAPIQCGQEALKHFAFEPGYRNFNHGAYGTYPIEIRSVFRHFQEATEAAPDRFVRYEYRTHRLNAMRALIAKYINAPLETCVYTPNATVAYDTIVRNLIYKPGDVIIILANVYDSFHYTLQHLAETTPLETHRIQYTLPISPDALCTAFTSAIHTLRSQNKNPRLALFDTITSTPAVRLPFERLTQLCKSLSILSCIDAAHGVGHIPLDMRSLDPDFFMSNCHKWLYVPRGCAVLYVPLRNQHLIRATLPTGFAFTPKEERGKKIYPPGQNDFTANFASVGTLDDNPCLCIEAALAWRGKVTWMGLKGEDAVMGYMRDLSRRGGEVLVKILGTEILDDEEKTLTRCSFVNVRLPLSVEEVFEEEVGEGKKEVVSAWLMKTMIVEKRISMWIGFYAGHWWARLGAQVYLTLKDYGDAGSALADVCRRAKEGEWER